MSNSNPLVSVLIPSYNHESYIEQTIRSIWDQSYRNIEIIVVDDLSSDGSVKLLEELRKQSPFPMEVAVNEDRLGPARTCNRAIARARGELISMTASDDFFVPDRFEWQVEKFRRDPALMIHYANGYIYQDGEIIGNIHKEKAERLLARPCAEILEYIYVNTSPLFMQTALIKKELLDAIQGFDEDVLADDWVMNVRIFRYLNQQGGRFAFENKPVFYYRKHGENNYKNFHRQNQLKLEFIEKYTPAELKDKATSNIVFSLAIGALRAREFRESFRFLAMSQKAKFSLRQTVKFVGKLFSAGIKS